eukprot:TRINITY_DN7703_c0_g1_i1.p1 TRINITY_DN7703_c0_g1~~TRINITY_DN7703_c0_g1_i1.p1  ORF type:complete len:1057 (-),score=241.58 TRINITY_DN7703_c0_g1_i1:7-3177(-)
MQLGRIATPAVQSIKRTNWKDVKTQRTFLESIAESLGLEKEGGGTRLDEWYQVKVSDVIDCGGSGLLKHYDRSIQKALKSIYPEHDWKPWKFENVARNFWKDLQNRKIFVDHLAKQLHFFHSADWIFLKEADILSEGGSGLLHHYGTVENVISQVLSIERPISDSHSEDLKRKSRRLLLDRISSQLNISKPEDWYEVREADIAAIHPLYVERLRPLAQNVVSAFDDCDLKIWKFAELDRAVWSQASVQRDYFDHLAKHLKLTSWEDWYAVSTRDVELFDRGQGLAVIESQHGGSLCQAITAVYNELQWNICNFVELPFGFWRESKHQLKLFDSVAERLGLSRWENWYKVRAADVIKFNGVADVLQLHSYSISKALSAIYPEKNWSRSRFLYDVEIHRNFFDGLAKKLKVQKLSDWKEVPLMEIFKHGGGAVLNQYDNSLSKALEAMYPEQLWTFSDRQPLGYWNNAASQRDFLDRFASSRGVKNWKDWFGVTIQDINEAGGAGLLNYYGHSLRRALAAVYPEHSWFSFGESGDSIATHKMTSLTSRSHVLLFETLKEIFPDTDVFMEFSDSDLVFAGSNQRIELDVAIPRFKLAFEYQGEQHFFNSNRFGLSDGQKQRDQLKRLTCEKVGITLVDIPFWWDGKADSLLATIHRARPDVVPESRLSGRSVAIPYEVPASVLDKQKRLELRRRLDLPFPPVKDWSMSDDPTDWWISEQLDGVRAYWNGNRLFLQRGSKPLQAPLAFTSTLPPIPLDGELWSDTENHQNLLKSIFFHNGNSNWEGITFNVFDSPQKHNLPFEQRTEHLQSLQNSLPAHVRWIQSSLCESPKQLELHLKEIAAKNGKGIILRKPNSLYFDVDSFKKANAYHQLKDEVLLLEIHENQLLCKLFEGNTFLVAKNELVENARLEEMTSVLTIMFDNTSVNGAPINPTIQKIRYDLEWKDVISEKERNSPISAYFLSFKTTRASCAGCRKIFHHPNEPRIRTKLSNWTPSSDSSEMPRAFHIHLCLDSGCINRAINRYQSQGLHISPYDGRVVVAGPVSDLPQVEGIQWVQIRR